jgi:hypothetical protein
MSRLLLAAALSCLASVASAQPCADRLHEVRPGSARAGDEIELIGAFADSRGTRRPMANRGGVNDLEVLHWSSTRILARLPGKLSSGTYKVGIYCDGRAGPQRFLYSTDWLDLEVRPAAATVFRQGPREAMPASPSAPAFDRWLAQQTELVNELVWEGGDGPELYPQWPDRRRQALYHAFRRSLDGEAAGEAPPPQNLAAPTSGDSEALRQILSEADAEAIYLDAVGHSLALEYAARLPWSLHDYPLLQREVLLDAREFFARSEDGYEIPFGIAGMALPSPSALQWSFLQPRLGGSRRATIIAVLDWLRERAVHFEGRASSASMLAQWQYPGYPPVARVLAGTRHEGRPTWPVRPRTAGCFGTAGFLRALLRSANIPVTMVSTCAHYQVHFPSEDLYLSHGDDPYSGEFREGSCPSERLLLDSATFDAWFRRGPEAQRCDNIGRGAREAANCP